ncbi:hypothetical protein CANCADRAFT_123 [Tortispora caseinolytica NRRL Y-17796]|uniref:Uncharacterized protein n=1 Tax=Tortispora caseinolytica NRRL Y-17796 TaxID=767744 RepID=A0A1E4TIQ2_9ASCO|nr:hypothetical protein CANCADRAFT_123 [Tortispora caseinolytica NRRL Y-17796]
MDLFSVESLDDELIPENEKLQLIKSQAKPSRWKSYEFYFYYLVFLLAVPQMFIIARRATGPHNETYMYIDQRLIDGWFFGMRFDNSDTQYRAFRGNFPALAIVMALHQAARHLLKKYPRISFDIGFGAVFLIALHGINFLKILGLVYGGYCIATRPWSHGTIKWVSWIYGLTLIFLIDWYDGFSFKALFGLNIDHIVGGLLPSWAVHFNFAMLRMISFTMDYLEAQSSSDDIEKKIKDGVHISEKTRVSTPAQIKAYTFPALLAYVTYTPLYIAGPIITFNDYIYQINHPIPRNWVHIAKYAVRYIVCHLTMEILLHIIHPVATVKAGAWLAISGSEILMLAYFNLVVTWLKLLIPWRFFRLWAMVDGIVTPENMLRCMSNNYSAMAFWRSWHRSYNKWVLRYIYIPLGGSKNTLLNTLIVFTFVAFWHDVQLRLFIWGWLISLFILPEYIAHVIFPAKVWSKSPIYRHMCAVGSVFNIALMMTANTIGFVAGPDALESMLQTISSTSNLYLLIPTLFVCLFAGVQVMYEVRESEIRRGINLRF